MKKTLIALFCVVLMVAMVVPSNAADAEFKATASTNQLVRGQEITVTVELKEAATFKVGGFKIVVDTTVFDVVSGQWAAIPGVLSNFDAQRNNAALMALSPFTVNSGEVFTLKLKVKATASAASSTVSFEPAFQNTDGSKSDIAVTSVTFTCPHTAKSVKYDGTNHWNECNVCKQKDSVKPHTFDNACDTSCNDGCGHTRVTTHTPAAAWQYDGTNHWHNCANCGTALTKTGHSFDNDCDSDCNEGCGFTRPTSHTPAGAWQTDGTYHWKNCSACGLPVNKTAHTFDNACDTTCNGGCGFTRPTTHNYSTAWSTNGTNHWHECTECHAKKDDAKHTYDNNCDTTCNDGCGYVRPTAHTPAAAWQTDGTYHWKNCSECGQPVNKTAHTFDNACDTTCNGGCGFTRPTTHNYSSTWSTNGTNHWHECSECHAKKDDAKHTGGTATCKEKAKCTVCNTAYGDLAPHKAVEKVDAQYLVSKADCVNKAVYKKSCETCGIALNDTFTTGNVDANNHVDKAPVIKNAQPAKCTVPGYTGDKHCAGCDAELEKGTPINAGHQLKKVDAKPAGCTDDGNIEYYECEGDCGKLYKDANAETVIENKEDVVVKATGHKTTKVDKVDSTTTKTGTEEHYKCDTCEKLFEDAEAKKEITDKSVLEIPKKTPSGNPQTGSNVAVLVIALVALVGSIAAIPAVISKRK